MEYTGGSFMLLHLFLAFHFKFRFILFLARLRAFLIPICEQRRNP
jgi:hypothetical protein